MIVIFEKSTREFHEIPDAYLHHGRTEFQTGLDMEFLQEYFLIALDVFRNFLYPKIRNEQTAWLSFLATENWEDAKKIIEEYPWLQEIYREIAMLRQRPEEVLGMFSEALRILDQNTMRYMVEELEKELEDKKNIIKEKEKALTEKDAALEQKDAALKGIKEEYEGIKAENESMKAEIEELRKRMEQL